MYVITLVSALHSCETGAGRKLLTKAKTAILKINKDGYRIIVSITFSFSNNAFYSQMKTFFCISPEKKFFFCLNNFNFQNAMYYIKLVLFSISISIEV
jgi:hypothetical protein